MTTYFILGNWRYTETIINGKYIQDDLTLVGVQVQNENWEMLVDADWEETKDTSEMAPCILKTQYAWIEYDFECDRQPEPSEFEGLSGLHIRHLPTGTVLEGECMVDDHPEYELINGYEPTENDAVEELVPT